MNIFESYMFEQPILIKLNAITPQYADLRLGVGGKEIDVHFINTEGMPPRGPGVQTYASTASDNLEKYGIDVAFTNDGKVHEIRKIYKDIDLTPYDVKNPPRFDMMHSSNVISST